MAQIWGRYRRNSAPKEVRHSKNYLIAEATLTFVYRPVPGPFYDLNLSPSISQDEDFAGGDSEDDNE